MSTNTIKYSFIYSKPDFSDVMILNPSSDIDREFKTFNVRVEEENGNYTVYIPEKVKYIPPISQWLTKKINNLKIVGGINLISSQSMFQNLVCNTLDISEFNSTNIANMSYMFAGSKICAIIGLETLNLSNTKDTQKMFWESSLSITEARHIFIQKDNHDYVLYIPKGVTKTSELSRLIQDVYTNNIKIIGGISLESTAHMFAELKCEILNICLLNTSKVKDMSCMFWDCRATEIIGLSPCNPESKEIVVSTLFTTSKVSNMYGMFHRCSTTILNFLNWDTSKLTNISRMFEQCCVNDIFGLENFNLINVRNLSKTFYQCKTKYLNVSSWNVSNIRIMMSTFSKCHTKALNLSNWNVSKLEIANQMFFECNIDEVYLSNWDLSKIKQIDEMFARAKIETLIVSDWNISKLINTHHLFELCSINCLIGLDTWNMLTIKNTSEMFKHSTIKRLDLSYWDISNIENKVRMFYGSIIETLNVSYWNTSKVKDMSYLFKNCIVKNLIGLNTWDTSSVKNVGYMFSGFQSEYLDISSFNLLNTESADHMFSNCKINQIKGLESWDLSKVKIKTLMFELASIYILDISVWNIARIKGINEMFHETEINRIYLPDLSDCGEIIRKILRTCTVQEVVVKPSQRTYLGKTTSFKIFEYDVDSIAKTKESIAAMIDTRNVENIDKTIENIVTSEAERRELNNYSNNLKNIYDDLDDINQTLEELQFMIDRDINTHESPFKTNKDKK